VLGAVIQIALTYAVGSLWVTNVNDGTVSRVDPVAARLVVTIRVGQGPITALAARNAIWVANYLGGSVSRIDPACERGHRHCRRRG